MLRVETIENGTVRLYLADTLEDILQEVESDKPRWGDCSTEEGMIGWRGTDTMAQALKLARHGWEAGRERMSNAIDSANVVQRQLAHKSEALDVAGSFPFVPSAVAGDPLCMVTRGMETSRSKPVVKLVVNIGYLGDVEAEAVITRGAAILSWVDRLEGLGYRCEVVCIQANAVRNCAPLLKTNNVFLAKSAGEPLDIDRCAFMLANPAMFRRLIFGAWERDPDLNGIMGGYGSSNDDVHKSVLPEHSVYFPSPTTRSGDWSSAMRAVAAVERHILKALQHSEVEADLKEMEALG